MHAHSLLASNQDSHIYVHVFVRSSERGGKRACTLVAGTQDVASDGLTTAPRLFTKTLQRADNRTHNNAHTIWSLLSRFVSSPKQLLTPASRHRKRRLKKAAMALCLIQCHAAVTVKQARRWGWRGDWCGRLGQQNPRGGKMNRPISNERSTIK